MNARRWTLAVVCTATAMLMLDIAVVNTALSRSPRTSTPGSAACSGSSTPTRSRSPRGPDRRLAGRPLRPPPRLRRPAWSSSPSRRRVRRRRPIDVLDAARAVQGLGAAILFAVSLALLADAFPSERERAGALAAYGATIGASFAIGPAVGGALTSGLDWRWVFLSTSRSASPCWWITLREVRESRDPRAPRVDVPGHAPSPPACSAGARPAARQRGRLGQPARSSPRSPPPGRCSPHSCSSRARSTTRCCRCSCSAPGLRRRAADRVRDLRLVLRDLPLRRRSTCSTCSGCRRSRPASCYLPGTLVMFVVSGATAQLGESPPGVLISGGLALVAAGMALMTLAEVDSLLDGRCCPGIDRRADRHGAVQPVGDRRRAELGPRRAERPGRRGERHVPPGRHRDRRRRARRAVPPGDRWAAARPPTTSTACTTALLAGAGLAAAGAIAAAVLIRGARATESSPPTCRSPSRRWRRPSPRRQFGPPFASPPRRPVRGSSARSSR